MDLLFFANTRHLKRADERLAEEGLGRAHHRALYFVARRPGITVSALLKLLGMTKQSLSRVQRELTARNMLIQVQGTLDKRQRLLYLTNAGIDFEKAIFDELHANVAQAYAAAGPEAIDGFWIVMQHLMGADGRQQFALIRSAS